MGERSVGSDGSRISRVIIFLCLCKFIVQNALFVLLYFDICVDKIIFGIYYLVVMEIITGYLVVMFSDINLEEILGRKESFQFFTT